MSYSNIQNRVEIIEFELTSHSGKIYDLKDIFKFLNIYSSINSYFKTINVIFVDTMDAVSNWGLIGGEELTLSIRSLDGEVWLSTAKLGHIEKEDSPIERNAKARILSLYFFTHEYFLNGEKTICRKLTQQTPNDIISFVYNDIFQTDKKLVFKENVENKIDLYINYWKPYEIIDFVVNQSYTQYYDFVFFENTNDEFIFSSISNLAKEEATADLFLEMEDKEKALSANNIVYGRMSQFFDFNDIELSNGLGTRYYKPNLLNYGYLREDISPADVESKMVFNGRYSTYCDEWRNNKTADTYYVNYNLEVAKYREKAKNYWNRFKFDVLTKGSLKRQPGTNINMSFPKLNKDIPVNKFFEGKWLIESIKTSISGTGEYVQTLSLLKNAIFNHNEVSSHVAGEVSI